MTIITEDFEQIIDTIESTSSFNFQPHLLIFNQCPTLDKFVTMAERKHYESIYENIT